MMLYFLEGVTVCVGGMEELVFKSQGDLASPSWTENEGFPALWKICEDHKLVDVLFLSLRVSFEAHAWIRVDVLRTQSP